MAGESVGQRDLADAFGAAKRRIAGIRMDILPRAVVGCEEDESVLVETEGMDFGRNVQVVLVFEADGGCKTRAVKIARSSQIPVGRARGTGIHSPSAVSSAQATFIHGQQDGCRSTIPKRHV
jgi:hypothetical protein